MSLAHVHVSHCTSSGAGSGAGIASHGPVFVAHCSFIHNRVVESIANPGNNYGGALSLFSTGPADDIDNPTTPPSIEIASCTFVNNTGGNGAAAAVFPADGYEMTPTIIAIRDSLFQDNAANTLGTSFGGGAMRLGIDVDLRLVLENTQFVNNTSIHYAGGLLVDWYHGRVIVDMADCVFDGNSASLRGGAISSPGLDPVTFIVSNTAFIHNSAEQGGAIEIETLGPFSWTGGSLSGNSAVTQGGGIFIRNVIGGANFSLSGLNIAGNSAGGQGGALAAIITNDKVSSSTLALTNSLITDNTADEGGALYVEAGPLSVLLDECSATGNTASTRGPTLLVLHAPSLVVRNTLISGNSVLGDTLVTGTGIHVDTVGSTVIDNPSVVVDNTGVAASHSGILCRGAGEISLGSSVVVTGNKYTGGGGAEFNIDCSECSGCTENCHDCTGSELGPRSRCSTESPLSGECVCWPDGTIAPEFGVCVGGAIGPVGDETVTTDDSGAGTNSADGDGNSMLLDEFGPLIGAGVGGLCLVGLIIAAVVRARRRDAKVSSATSKTARRKLVTRKRPHRPQRRMSDMSEAPSSPAEWSGRHRVVEVLSRASILGVEGGCIGGGGRWLRLMRMLAAARAATASSHP